MVMISVVILTRNNEDTIKRTLSSVMSFNEIIIIDTGSCDSTIDIARSFDNTKIIKSKFTTFGSIRNKGASIASNNWILAIDSDEELSQDLAYEINKIHLDDKCVYSLPFINIYNKKHIKWCGWHPERHVRLYNKNTTSFSNDHVHEKIVTSKLKIINLQKHVYHYSYRNISDFLNKMEIYSSHFAKQYQHKKKSSFIKAILHGSFAFFKSYIIKRGILGGSEGFIISLYNANTAFYKYLKLSEANKKQKNAADTTIS
jgi:glycosyltransferase involved in cell wall biosynthesis